MRVANGCVFLIWGCPFSISSWRCWICFICSWSGCSTAVARWRRPPDGCILSKARWLCSHSSLRHYEGEKWNLFILIILCVQRILSIFQLWLNRFFFFFFFSFLDSLVHVPIVRLGLRPCIKLEHQATICTVSSYEWNLLHWPSCLTFAFVATFRPQ